MSRTAWASGGIDGSTDVFVRCASGQFSPTSSAPTLRRHSRNTRHPPIVSEGVETFFLSSEATTTRPGKPPRSRTSGPARSPSRARRGSPQEHPLDMPSRVPAESSFRPNRQDSMTRHSVLNRASSRGILCPGRRGHARPSDRDRLPHEPEGREELASSEHREAIARAIYASLASTSAATTSACARCRRSRQERAAAVTSAQTAGPRISCAPSRSPATTSPPEGSVLVEFATPRSSARRPRGKVPHSSRDRARAG